MRRTFEKIKAGISRFNGLLPEGALDREDPMPLAPQDQPRAIKPLIIARLLRGKRYGLMCTQTALPRVVKGAVLTPFVGFLPYRINVSMFWMADTRYSWMAIFHSPRHRARSKPKRVARA